MLIAIQIDWSRFKARISQTKPWSPAQVAAGSLQMDWECHLVSFADPCYTMLRNSASGLDLDRIQIGKASKWALRPAFGRPEGRF